MLSVRDAYDAMCLLQKTSPKPSRDVKSLGASFALGRLAVVLPYLLLGLSLLLLVFVEQHGVLGHKLAHFMQRLALLLKLSLKVTISQ